MSQNKESTIKRWPGHVIFPNYLNFDQIVNWEKALAEAKLLGDDATPAQFYQKLLPSIFNIVEEWHITGIPEHPSEKDLPGSLDMVVWLIEIVTDLYRDTQGIDPKPQEP